MRKVALGVLLPCALQALARTVDAANGLLLHTSLDLPDFLARACELFDGRAFAARLVVALVLGTTAWRLAAELLRRSSGVGQDAALRAAAQLFRPLYLGPALTLLACIALGVRPVYPYGFTLPVALTQDWARFVDTASGAAVLALLWQRCAPRFDWEWPGPRAVAFVAFLGFALATPESARNWDGHPGNEPKYLRMALALGHFGSFDIERVAAPMDQLGTRAASEWIGPAGHRIVAAMLALPRALWSHDGLALERVRSVPLAHLTVRGTDGGAYHVLAPGPALLLAPCLRLDRWLNRWRATPGRLDLTVLAFNLLAALLVAGTYALARDVAGSAPAALVVSLLLATTPPLLFYAHEFYPELPAALVCVFVLLALLARPHLRTRAWVWIGLGLAALPWLHQKYLPVWSVLTLVATWRLVERLEPLRALAALALPQLVSLATVLAYNLALTGSPRPDALFRALGREGVFALTLGQGALGLWLDARYGLLPCVPWLLLGFAGAFVPTPSITWLRPALLVAGSYYLTVAAAENWTGSISHLGRFLLPLVPLLAVLAAALLARLPAAPGALALVFVLVGWSWLCARLLWLDPLAANDSAVLFGPSIYADGHVYLPDLLFRHWRDASVRLLVQLGLLSALVVAGVTCLARSAAGRGGLAPLRTWLVSLGLLGLVALALESWPGQRAAARFEQLRIGPESVVLVHGAAQLSGERLWIEAGASWIVVRTDEALRALELRPTLSPLHLPHTLGRALPGVWTRAPLQPFATLQGRRGRHETLALLHWRAAQATGLEIRRPAPGTLR